MRERKFFRIPKVIINMHTHGRDMEEKGKTTVGQVLMEAKKGLISILGFMPNTKPPVTSIEIYREYLTKVYLARKKAKFEHEQYIWFGVTDDNLTECEQALQLDSVIGLKIYPKLPGGKVVTTGSGQIGVALTLTIKKAIGLGRKYNKPVAVHCDDPVIIDKVGNTIRAEVSYVKKVLDIARQVPGAKIVICHVSCKDSAELILQAQVEGIKTVIELCPHYLWFDSEGTNWKPGLDPVFYKCLNNIRGPKHREYLVSLLNTNNPLIIISSDDAQHTEKEKIQDKLGGIPGNQEMVPATVTLAIQNGISERRVAQLLSFNASDFFEIPAPRELIQYEWEKRVDDLLYNEGRVINPWNGSELFFPIMN